MSAAGSTKSLRRFSSSRVHRCLLRYGFAVVAVAVATTICYWLEKFSGVSSAYVIFYPTVMLVAVVAGLGPGLTATLFSSAAADYLFLEPHGSFAVTTLGDRIELALFLGIGAAISVLAETMRRRKSELKRSRSDLSRALAVAKVGSWHLDIAKDVRTWSDETYRLLGIPLGTLPSRARFLERVHQKDLQLVDDTWNTFLQGATYDFEHRIVVDGEIKWVQERGEIESDTEGKPRFAMGVIQDVTQRKRAEEGLRHSEAEARERASEVAAILDAVPAMTFIAHDRACQEMTSSRAAYDFLKLPYGANTSKSAAEGERPRNFRLMKDGYEVSADELPVQRAAATGQPVRDCELTLVFEDGSSTCIYGHAVPLRDAKGTVRGAVGAFVDITGRRRLEELTIRGEIQRNLVKREIMAREEERLRLARELHDEFGQMLVSLLAGLRLVEDSKTLKAAKTQLKTLRELASHAIDEVGRLARDLHPIVLDDLGLAVALKSYVSEYSRLHGIEAQLRIVGFGSERLPRVLERGLYRIVQEGLTNVARHARAKAVTVLISCVGEELTMTISDNGCGFRTETSERGLKTHLGCQGMRERASMLGGKLEIESRVGSGTCITVKIPTGSVGLKQAQSS